MKKAVLFRENEGHKIVSAEDVKNGLYSRYEEFVDHKFEEFKVQYISCRKGMYTIHNKRNIYERRI